MDHVTAAEKTKLYVKDWGSGQSVILMHGWPLSADSWDDQAMAIADAGYRAIAYDRGGFGHSSQPWGGFDYDTLADDLAAVVEQTGARDPVLAGFSMGGGEVARFMSRYAGMVAQCLDSGRPQGGQDGADRRFEPSRGQEHLAQHAGRVRRRAARPVRDPQAPAHEGPD